MRSVLARRNVLAHVAEHVTGMIEMRVATAATLTVAASHGPVAVGIARDDWSVVAGEEQSFGGEVTDEVAANVE